MSLPIEKGIKATEASARIYPISFENILNENDHFSVGRLEMISLDKTWLAVV